MKLEINKRNMNKNKHAYKVITTKTEIYIIRKILIIIPCGAEAGSIFRVPKYILLDCEKSKLISQDYMYGFVSTLEGIYGLTKARAWTLYWYIEHFNIVYKLLYIVPVYEHNMTVVKFPDKDGDMGDNLLTK